MADTSEVIAYYQRIKWVIVVLFRLHRQQYSGSITFDMHRGDLSTKYKRQVVEVAVIE